VAACAADHRSRYGETEEGGDWTAHGGGGEARRTDSVLVTDSRACWIEFKVGSSMLRAGSSCKSLETPSLMFLVFLVDEAVLNLFVAGGF